MICTRSIASFEIWSATTLERMGCVKAGLAQLACAFVFYMAGSETTRALDFTCIEASRYYDLAQIFNGDRGALAAYLGLAPSQMADASACRAILVTGTIRSGDAEALLDQIARGKGLLAVVYLSFEGTHVSEEVKLAQIIRRFWLKTVHIRDAPFDYSPDFAAPWGARTVKPSDYEDYERPPELSRMSHALRAFSQRKEVALPAAAASAICTDSCVGAWMAGAHRRTIPMPPLAPTVYPPGPIPEMVSAPMRARLLNSLGEAGPPQHVTLGRLPGIPPPIELSLRKQCNSEFASAEATMGFLISPASMFEQLDMLRTAGVRLEQCVARAYERERFVSFQHQCGGECDKKRLSQEFNRSTHDFIEKSLSLAALTDGEPGGVVPRQWHLEEEGGRGLWTRRTGVQIFDATWTVADRQQAAGTVEINRVGDRITAVRTQTAGQCLYQGIIADQTAPGTYTCFWMSGAFAWQAATHD